MRLRSIRLPFIALFDRPYLKKMMTLRTGLSK